MASGQPEGSATATPVCHKRAVTAALLSPEPAGHNALSLPAPLQPLLRGGTVRRVMLGETMVCLCSQLNASWKFEVRGFPECP